MILPGGQANSFKSLLDLASSSVLIVIAGCKALAIAVALEEYFHGSPCRLCFIEILGLLYFIQLLIFLPDDIVE